MYWDCKDVRVFWTDIGAVLSIVLNLSVPYSPIVLLHNTSSLNLTNWNKSILLTGITIAKKMLALCWKLPHTIARSQWINTYADIVNMYNIYDCTWILVSCEHCEEIQVRGWGVGSGRSSGFIFIFIIFSLLILFPLVPLGTTVHSTVHFLLCLKLFCVK